MERVKRMAVVVVPRETLLDWVNSLNPDEPVWLDSIADRGNVYLIPQYGTIEEAEDHLEEHFDEIFTNELSDWFEDSNVWPQERTYEMFIDWFDVFFDVVVWDTVPTKLEKEKT